MGSFDSSIVNLGAPTIQRNMHASYAEVQLMIAGYFLTYGAFVITGGKIGDRFGRRRTYILGIILFVIASAVCGFAPNATVLLIARLAQGAAAALEGPQGMGMVQTVLPPAHRARAFAAVTITLSLGAFLGPVVGGMIIAADFGGLSWRPIFLINVPVGLITTVAAMRVIPNVRTSTHPQLDLWGSLLAALGFSLLLYPLVQGRNDGWPLWSFEMLGAAPLTLAIFLIYCARRVRAGKSALINPQFFKLPLFLVPSTTLFIFMGVFWAFCLGVMYYVQLGLGFTVLHSSFTLLPYAVSQVIGSRFAARLYAKFGKLMFFAGIGAFVLSVMSSLAVVQAVGNSMMGWELAPTLAIGGFGIGMIFPVIRQTLMGSVPPKDAGVASGFLNLTQLTGSAFGIAVIGLLYFGSLGSYSGAAMQTQIPAVTTALASDGMPASESNLVISGMQTCFQDRLNSNDPYAIPASCNFQNLPNDVRPIVETAIQNAIAADFRHSLEDSMGILALFTLVTFIGFARMPSRSAAQAAPAAGPAQIPSPTESAVPATAVAAAAAASAPVSMPPAPIAPAVPEPVPAIVFTQAAVSAPAHEMNTVPKAWYEALRNSSGAVDSWIPLPAGKIVHAGLQSDYVKFDRLMQSMTEREFTGYVNVNSLGFSGAILFENGGPVVALARTGNAVQCGDIALGAIVQIATKDGASIEIVQVHRELTRCLAQVMSGKKIPTAGTLPPMLKMVSHLEGRRFHGGLVVHSGADTGVILFVPGNGTVSYLSSSPAISGGAASVANTLLPDRIEVLGVLLPEAVAQAAGTA